MIKAAKVATITALALIDDVRPKPISRVKRFTAPLPELSPLKKVTTPRKKHVCRWSDQEVWGAVFFALLVGIFIGYCIG